MKKIDKTHLAALVVGILGLCLMFLFEMSKHLYETSFHQQGILGRAEVFMFFVTSVLIFLVLLMFFVSRVARLIELRRGRK